MTTESEKRLIEGTIEFRRILRESAPLSCEDFDTKEQEGSEELSGVEAIKRGGACLR